MATYRIDANEFLLVYLTMLARDEEGGHIEYFSQWFNDGGKEKLRDLFNSLKDKGCIRKEYNPDVYEPNEIEFNKNFIKSWFKYSGKMGEELFNAYPGFMNIQGRYVPLKDISKKFNTLDEFFFFYGTQIGHNEAKHVEVMEILEWAKDNGHITFGLCNFVIGHQWEALRELRDNPELVPISQTSIYTDD